MRRGATLAVLLALAGCAGTPSAGPPRPAGTTLVGTLADPDGDGALDRAPGEPMRDRAELAPVATPGAVLVTFAQMTDLHIRDEESPVRVPFLDRYGEPFGPTFRPQEALTTQVAAAAVRAIDRQHPQAVFVTGDLIDNAQRNELSWATRVLDGGRVTPDSGARGYRGVQQADDPDPFYYRPDVDPPRHRGLLAAAQRPFVSPGLDAPWYGLAGNHDVLLQGELAPDARTDAIARGSRLVTSLDPRTRLPRRATTPQAVDALLGAATGGRSIRVPTDPERQAVADAVLVRTLARGRRTRVPDRTDYTVDIGRGVRAIMLDLTNRAGGAAGVTDAAQLAWLRDQLRAAGDRPVIVFSHQSLPEAVLALLDDDTHVVAAVHGHTHRNRLTPRGHYWIVSTSALIDYPMQSRMFRLRETAGGGHVLETWMIDQDGSGLAGTGRELAFLDPQGGRPLGYAGTAADRNARLFVPG
jgi:3',5'-cyclic AMP phosphodiesterase CpdA